MRNFLLLTFVWDTLYMVFSLHDLTSVVCSSRYCSTTKIKEQRDICHHPLCLPFLLTLRLLHIDQTTHVQLSMHHCNNQSIECERSVIGGCPSLGGIALAAEDLCRPTDYSILNQHTTSKDGARGAECNLPIQL